MIAGNRKLPSISRRLTISLILSVALVSITMIGLNYYNTNRDAKAQLNHKADDYSTFLANSLGIPLWNFESETINHIGSVYSQNEHICALKITGSDGKIYFDIQKEGVVSQINRQMDILYDGMPVGAIELALTSRIFDDYQNQLLQQSIIAIFGVLIVVGGLTGFLLRLFLKRPLNHLSDLMGAYTSGPYNPAIKPQTSKEFQRVVDVLGDMSEQITRQMSQLQTAEEKYRSIVDSANEAILTLSAEGAISSWNIGASRVFGYKSEEVLGKSIAILVPDELKTEHQTLFFKALHKEPLQGHKTTRLRKDGSRFPVELSVGPLKNDDGEVVGLSEIIRDTTQQTESQKRFKLMEQRLFQSQKMEAIGTLAGGIAHDFNNILSAVIGYTELLQMNLPATSEEFDYARQIKQAGNRARDLVQQILTFSRQTEQELKPVEVSTIVKEVIKLLRSSLPTTIEIKHHIQGSSLIMGDPTQLHQILMNLCTNSGHAMQEKGGLLSIELLSIDLKENLMSDQVRLNPGAYVQLSVSDTGHGMPAEYLDRIFDPFFSTKERGEGTGMGLSVVHGIVQSYNGAIYVHSEEGKGSTFKIFLPAIERRTEPAKRETDDILKGTGHILFVDDEPILVKMSTSQLEALGYTVSSRTNSLEALALFKKNPNRFDLVITDMTMPKMTGDEFAREIKQIRPDIPIILCTGFSSKITPDNVQQFDIDAFLMKPIIIQDMAQVVRDVMGKNNSVPKPMA